RRARLPGRLASARGRGRCRRTARWRGARPPRAVPSSGQTGCPRSVAWFPPRACPPRNGRPTGPPPAEQVDGIGPPARIISDVIRSTARDGRVNQWYQLHGGHCIESREPGVQRNSNACPHRLSGEEYALAEVRPLLLLGVTGAVSPLG